MHEIKYYFSMISIKMDILISLYLKPIGIHKLILCKTCMCRLLIIIQNLAFRNWLITFVGIYNLKHFAKYFKTYLLFKHQNDQKL